MGRGSLSIPALVELGTLELLAGVAAADTLTLTLPAYTTSPVNQTKGLSSLPLDTITDRISNYGFYVGGNDGNYIGANWGTPEITIDSVTYREGTWNNGILTLAGRSGVGGLGAAFVFGQDIAAGTTLTNISFSAQDYVNNPLDGEIKLELALRDASGEKVVGIEDVTNITFNSKSEDLTSIKLNGTFTWQKGYKIYGIVRGVSGDATTAYIVDGISASATTASVPEPTTATLSLLALAGLAARRRRK